MRHVILGGGITGTTAAEELRKIEPAAEITLVSEEEHPVYSRVLLPHYVKGKVPRERVFLKKESWYAEQNIDWMPGVLCERIDPRNRFVALSNGRELPYDKLLVATGGDVRTAPVDGPEVSYFRTLGDADHLVSLLARRAADTRADVYGGGFIACEYLNIFAQNGIPSALRLRGDRFWSRVLDDQSAALLNAHLRSKGVDLVLNSLDLPSGLPASPSIQAFGLGLAPDLSWLRDAGIGTNISVLTNEFLETNVPDIYAAGDIAEFFDVIAGRQVNVGNWMNAQTQGRAVARNMAGDRAAFSLVSSYATNALGLEMIFIGDTDRPSATRTRVLGRAEDGSVAHLFERSGKLVGATLFARNGDRAKVTAAIKAGVSLEEVGLE